MNDPVTMLFNAIFSVITWFACKMVDGLRYLVFSGITRSNSSRRAKPNKVQQTEDQRLAGCRDVVLSYANHLGYIARECMSREELSQKIDSGITPAALAKEIQAY